MKEIRASRRNYFWHTVLLDVHLFDFVRNDQIRQIAQQPSLSVIVKSRQLSLSSWACCSNAHDSWIIFEQPPENWRRQLGSPRLTWIRNISDDLWSFKMELTDAIDTAQNHLSGGCWLNRVLRTRSGASSHWLCYMLC